MNSKGEEWMNVSDFRYVRAPIPQMSASIDSPSPQPPPPFQVAEAVHFYGVAGEIWQPALVNWKGMSSILSHSIENRALWISMSFYDGLGWHILCDKDAQFSIFWHDQNRHFSFMCLLHSIFTHTAGNMILMNSGFTHHKERGLKALSSSVGGVKCAPLKNSFELSGRHWQNGHMYGECMGTERERATPNSSLHPFRRRREEGRARVDICVLSWGVTDDRPVRTAVGAVAELIFH